MKTNVKMLKQQFSFFRLFYFLLLFLLASPGWSQCDFNVNTEIDVPASYDCNHPSNFYCKCEDLANTPLPFVPNVPNGHTFRDMISVNAGPDIDQFLINTNGFEIEDVKAVSNKVRFFHLMEKDYGKEALCGAGAGINKTYPAGMSSSDLDALGKCPPYDPLNPSLCNDPSNFVPIPSSLACDPSCVGNLVPPLFSNNQVRCATIVADSRGPDNTPLKINTALEALYPIDYVLNPISNVMECKVLSFDFPNKWFTRAQWGGGLVDIKANAYAWTKTYLASYCNSSFDDCIISKLEVGNEPWGQPGQEAYQAILLGVIEAFCEVFGNDVQQWPIQLGTAALQATQDDPLLFDYTGTSGVVTGDNISGMLPLNPDILAFFGSVGIHPYSFQNCTTNFVRPEQVGGDFGNIAYMANWLNDCVTNNMGHAELSVSEFGWNSNELDVSKPARVLQSGYLARAILMTGRWGASEAVVYEMSDNPFNSLYRFTGLITTDGNRFPLEKKESYHMLSNFRSQFGDLKFLKSYSEDDEGLYLFVLGDDQNNPTHAVAWLATDIAESEMDFSLPTTDFPIPGTFPAEFMFSATGTRIDDAFPTVSVLNNGMLQVSPIPVLIPITTDCAFNDLGCLDCGGDLSCDECPFDIIVETSNIECLEGQHPLPPGSFYSFDLTVSRSDCGEGTWRTMVGTTEVSGQYGETVTVTPVNVNLGVLQLEINDPMNYRCTATTSVTPPEPCFSECEFTIITSVSNLFCRFNGTEFVFSFNLSIHRSDGFFGGWFSTGDVNMTGFYQTTIPMGPYPVSGGPINLTIHDALQPSCTRRLMITSPSECFSEFRSDQEKGLSGFTTTMDVFPNPARDEVEVQWSAPGYDELVIYQIEGKYQARIPIPENIQSKRIPLEELSQGMYFIQLRSKQQGVEPLMTKFVKIE